jgi:ParB/RepB/Spo0J family partition protein
VSAEGKEKRKDFTDAVRIHRLPGTSPVPPPIHPVSKIPLRREVREIELDKITPDPNQPRKQFLQSSLEDLAVSIRGKGVLQPIAVRRVGEDAFRIIHGERRWRASRLAQKETVPSIVYDDIEDAPEIQLIENMQRENLLPEDLAPAVAKRLSERGCTQEELAASIGKNRTFVSKCLKISEFLSAPHVLHEIKNLRSDGNYNIGFERFYEAAAKPSVQEALAFIRSVAEEKLTTAAVRERATSSRSSKPWDGRRFIQHLKVLRKQMILPFNETIPLDGDKHKISEEIDNTIATLDGTVQSLRSIKQKLSEM